MTEAYAAGQTIRLTADQINDIIADMTEAEKAYLEAAKELFHTRAGEYINKTSLALDGYSKATVDNYFPIHTDSNYTKTDFKSIMNNGSVEGQGFLKERVNASNPILLDDITNVVNRQIRGVALYAGLAIPVRNYNAVKNVEVWGEDDYGTFERQSSVRKAITNAMGEKGMAVLDSFVEDLQEMQRPEGIFGGKFLNRMSGNYVKSVLLGNAKVAMKQVASYPTAAAVIPWKYLAKALVAGGKNHALISRADVDLINKYTPLYRMRQSGNANEIASIMNKPGMEQRLPALLGWITGMDLVTVGRIWSAAEYMVADQQKYLAKGSDAYYKAVAKVFNEAIQQTQPNFTPLQRSAALRSKNPIVRSLTLFGTQRMQNGGLMLEAALELAQSKGKSKEQIAAARTKFGRVVASQFVQNALLLAASLAVDALRGRMKAYQDDDDDITPESVAKYLGDSFLANFFGSFLGGSEAYGLISGIFKNAAGMKTYDQEFSVPTLDALETIANFVQGDLPNAIGYLMGDHTSEEKKKKFINVSTNLAKVIGYATGLPLENLIKDFTKGWIPMLNDHLDWYKTHEMPLYLHQSGKLDSAKESARYASWTDLGGNSKDYFRYENDIKAIDGSEDKWKYVNSISGLSGEQRYVLASSFSDDAAAKAEQYVNDFGLDYDTLWSLKMKSINGTKADDFRAMAEDWSITVAPDPDK